ncbi:MAG: hypothetical protein WBA97_37460 [Actinophytocola sp.]|uniref:hypothetical protein n=1 Tax=Actinophytocola sp. TaxID=1872138 RepID=UPI003C769955
MDAELVHPDGLTSEDIDQLLREAAAHWTVSARPTSAFLDGTAEQRRVRRTARREIGAVVRVLPSRPQVASPAGEVA